MLKFENPQFFLWAIPLAALLLFWSWKSYAGLGRGRRYLATGLRGLGLLAILAGLARPVLFLPAEDEAVIYVLDISDSTEDSALEHSLAHVLDATSDLERHQSSALVVFAGQPKVQRTLDTTPIEPKEQSLEGILHRRNRTKFQSALQTLETAETPDAGALKTAQDNLERIEKWRQNLQIERTDTAAALRLARSLIPVEARGRLVLFTDGNHNRGQVGRELRALRESGITVNTHTPPPSEHLEVLAQAIEMPAEVHVKQPFNLTVHIVANQPTSANVTLFRNGFRIANREMELKKGTNQLRMERLTLDEGYYSYEALVEAKGDTRLENNAVRGAVKVAGKPKVLLVERQPGASRYLIEALESQGLSVEERPAAGAPTDLRDLLNYDALVLSDLPSEHFRPGAMEAVKTYVREMGGGLIMIGGEKASAWAATTARPSRTPCPCACRSKRTLKSPT
ncbi:MAG: VWA domain-containing protein [Planctomycetota bacterium]|nr:VWA domain-containing protein [Planctomycetota bacterium]